MKLVVIEQQFWMKCDMLLVKIIFDIFLKSSIGKMARLKDIKKHDFNQKYSNTSYIFSGVKTPNPYDLRPCVFRR